MAPRWALGVCRLAWRTDAATASVAAARLGFDHLDILESDEASGLSLPVGIRLAARPTEGTAWPAPPGGASWADEVNRLRRTAHPVVEPWAGSLFGSDEAVHRLVVEVPEIRLVVDTGHVTQWGGNILNLLRYADHVQLRQAAPGKGQLPGDQGDVDFAAVLDRLDTLGYDGLLSVEYFDLPRFGWPLDDPPSHAAALAAMVRPLMERYDSHDQ